MYSIDLNRDTFTPALEKLASGLADMSPVMHQIGEYLLASTKDRFEEGKAPSGEPWAPKSPGTIKTRRTSSRLFRSGLNAQLAAAPDSPSGSCPRTEACAGS